MVSKNRVIIDTDPGVDDVLALLLAFSAKTEELEVLLLSVTHGNVDVQSCLRNIVTLFHFIEKEQEWRKQNGRPEGFETLKSCKPIVAVGAEEPLADQQMLADFFHGIDGLGGIHTSHPHLSPAETWKSLFKAPLESSNPEEVATAKEVQNSHSLFTPSHRPAPEEMLRLLRENEPNTITIVAIGPLTNLAIAASIDPETFLRAKEVIVMGGAVDVPGNVIPPPNLSLIYSSKIQHLPVPPFGLIKQPDSPVRRMLNLRNQMSPGAEFNTFADSVAAARVFALTGKKPGVTMPVIPEGKVGKGHLGPYPETLSRRLTVKLFPLDITTPHLLPRNLYTAFTQREPLTHSPLATWTAAFLSATYNKVLSLKPASTDPETVGLELHDPLTIWYCLTASDPKWKFTQDEDIRIETAGQWTRGVCVVDRRGKRMGGGEGEGAVVAGDTGSWLDSNIGNRINRCVGTPGVDRFASVLLSRAFGVEE